MDSIAICTLLILALALFFAEVLVPSGGLLGVGAMACLISGIVMLFKVNTTAGLAASTVTVLVLPILIIYALKFMPRTPVARILALTHRQKRLTGNQDTADEPELVGTFGKALNDLRPVGTCLIKGRRHDCLAASGVIAAGCRVQVVSVDGIQIKVVKVDQ